MWLLGTEVFAYETIFLQRILVCYAGFPACLLSRPSTQPVLKNLSIICLVDVEYVSGRADSGQRFFNTFNFGFYFFPLFLIFFIFSF